MGKDSYIKGTIDKNKGSNGGGIEKDNGDLYQQNVSDTSVVEYSTYDQEIEDASLVEHDEYEQKTAHKKGKSTFFDKIRALWNGENTKNIKIEFEEVLEESIENGNKLWVGSSVEYDDLSDYAPKEHMHGVPKGGMIGDNNDIHALGGFSWSIKRIKSRISSFLNPSLGPCVDPLENNSKTNKEFKVVSTEKEDDSSNGIKAKRSSPFKQMKTLWNEDGGYDDEGKKVEALNIGANATNSEDENTVNISAGPVFRVLEPSATVYEDENIVRLKDEMCGGYDDKLLAKSRDYDGKGVVLDIFDNSEALNKTQENMNIIKLQLDRFENAWNNKKSDEPNAVKPGCRKSGVLYGNLEEMSDGAKEKITQGEIKANDNRNAEDPDMEGIERVVSGGLNMLHNEESNIEGKNVFGDAGKDHIDDSLGRDEHDIPEYIHESLVKKIDLINENMSRIVRYEYGEYIKQERYKPLTEGANRAKSGDLNRVDKGSDAYVGLPGEKGQSNKLEVCRTEFQGEKEKRKRSIRELLFGNIENSAEFSEFIEQTTPNVQGYQAIEDYNRPSDAKVIRDGINYDYRKVSFQCIALSIIFLLVLGLYVVQGYFPKILMQYIPDANMMTCVASLMLILISAAICHSAIIEGLKPLLIFRGNSDTAVAVAVVGCIAQGIASLSQPQNFYNMEMHLYAIISIAALLLNSLGKLCVVKRVKENFRFVSSFNGKYAAKFFEDENLSDRMFEKTVAKRPMVVFQNRAKFLEGFLKFSYMPDPSGRMASFMAPITTVIAVAIAIVCGILKGSIGVSISSFTLVACMGLPACCLLAVNLPMKRLCSDALKNGAMIVGYPAVKQFSRVTSIMIDSRELYPKDRVKLLNVKTFDAYNIDRALLNSSAVMRLVSSPISYMFEDVISEIDQQLPDVESIEYKDGLGVVSWVGGERLLIGNRDLMKRYSIDLPSLDFEQHSVKSETNCITYLASAGQLVAMFVTEYKADKKLVQQLRRLEKNGVTFFVKTNDANVTQLQVAKDFGIYLRSVKILPAVIGDGTLGCDEKARALISTQGRLYSLARAINGCIRIKDKISISMAIQTIAIVLGVLIAGVVAIFAEVSELSVVGPLAYMAFWTVASIVAPMIQKA